MYEVHFSLPLKERNLHVQQRWALIRSVEKQLADKNFSADALSTLKLKIQVAIREASMLRSARAALLVDHKGVPCDAQRAVRLRIEKNGHPRADSHWLSELNALLTKLSSAGETVTAKGAEPRPETPPKRTLRDYFTPPALTIPPATLERFFASPRSSPSSSNPPTERICPVMGTLPEPSPQYLSHEETLVSFVESIARDQGISATGALDHILHTARGNEIPNGPWLCPDCLQDHVSAPPSRGTDADYVPSVTCTDATSASASSSNSSSSSDSSDGTSDSSDDSSSDSSNSSSSDSDDSSGSASD